MLSAPDGLARETPDWPAPASAIAAAREFLQQTSGRLVAVACDSDVDGLASAVIVERAIRSCGGTPHVLPVERGEHVHSPSMSRRIAALRPASLVVVDMGSRPQRIVSNLPTLVVDHHDARAGSAPGALVVNGFDRPPVAPTSVLAYVIARAIAPIAGGGWLAALGAIADLGSAAAFQDITGVPAGGARWTRAVSLLNAARRAANPDPALALDTLREAWSVDDITSGRLAQTAVLERFQAEVHAEVSRCSRIPPTIAGDTALIRFASGAQVHPLVAIRWSHRLRPRIVIAANDGYLPGRTNFAVRSAGDIDLLAWLRARPFRPSPRSEYANGHARATGGSLSTIDFDRFLTAIGFRAPLPEQQPVAHT
jgi:hypothetical protein